MLCLLLLLLALGYYINPAPGAKPVDNSAQTQAVPEAPAPPLASPRSASPEHSHDVPEVLASVVENQFEQKAHWFDAPALDSRGLYLGQSTPLTLDPSCAARPELNFPSLEAALESAIGIDLRQRTPDTVLVEELVQFWRLGANYYQLSARWEKDMPASYRLNHFRAQSANLETGLEHLPAPVLDRGPSNPGADIISVGRYFDALETALRSQGAEMGARLVHLLPGPPDAQSGAEFPQETLDLKLNNGRPVAWMFGLGRCQRRTTGDAFCRCLNPDDPEHSDLESFRAHD